MPTGITAPIYDGKEDFTFEDFLWRCARQFGYLVSVRDSATDAKIPEAFEPSSWHVERLAEARDRLREVETWDAATAERRARDAYTEAVAKWEEAEVRKAERKTRYEAMLEKVDAWQPPSEDHVKLKEFMRQQLVDSIEHDCGDWSWGKPELQDGETFKAKAIAEAERSIDYHSKEMAREEERARASTVWVQQIRDSLTKEVPA